ncbi:MAG TPA: SpoIIE family protein phosphatase [Leptospiraceae bacterium]|nr:SpoIIE family protein phosphatase [Leptospiraceae bacterium]HNM03546.1 SpoIIE family protein phosphatase [Leptospiraceae bacterium]
MHLPEFLLSYHSIGVFLVSVILLIETLFLVFKRDKKKPSYWLIGVFTGFTVMLVGYFLAYSVYDPIGAFHRYLTVFVLFGNFCFVGFAYTFLKEDYQKEYRLIMPFLFLTALGAYIHFIWNTYSAEKNYNFEAHCYNFNFGTETSLFILFFFLWSLFILVRKTVSYSLYDGFFKKWLIVPGEPSFLFRIQNALARFCAGFICLFFPRGKAANSTKTFILIIMFLIITAVSNVLNKAGILPYDYYAVYYSNSTLVICFLMLLGYMNSSGESTTFMVKLVGISLLAVLLVLGFVSNLTLNISESDFDKERLAEVKAEKKFIASGNFSSLADEIEYVVRKPVEVLLFEPRQELLYSKDKAVTQEILIQSEIRKIDFLVSDKLKEIRKKFPERSGQETFDLARQEFIKGRQFRNVQESLQKTESRGYRIIDGKNYICYDFVEGGVRYEVGFQYLEYRKHTHENAKKLLLIIVITVISILVIFPYFFNASLVHPLNALLLGVQKVNEGNLDVEVPIREQDEIGYLAASFNSMVFSIQQARNELKDYANTLEDKVKERTFEVEQKMREVETLKIQQDGDYFLTSLLARPLFVNLNESPNVKTDFIIRQKKTFEFRNRKAELGGDVCITGNLVLGSGGSTARYTMAVNGDAMGKSMQGAGGAIVMGVVIHSILARSRSSLMTPEEWMRETYFECNAIFKSFNSTMVMSAVTVLINDFTGEMFYWNAEHPFSILYRDKRAEFLEDGMSLRKLGLDSEFTFQVKKFQLQPDDILILGSDGRDDIDMTPDEPVRTINDDETLILKTAEKADADLEMMEKIIANMGNITDDLSLLKIVYTEAKDRNIPVQEIRNSSVIEAASEAGSVTAPFTGDIYGKAKEFFREGKTEEALVLLKQSFGAESPNPNLNRLLGLVAFKEKEYELAARALEKYLESDPENHELLYHLSIACKKNEDYEKARLAAIRVYNLKPENANNLVNLADIYRLEGNSREAEYFAKKAMEAEPENQNAKKILELLDEIE